jgi:hypothetical protein
MSVSVFSMLINKQGKRWYYGMHALELGIENFNFRVDLS